MTGDQRPASSGLWRVIVLLAFGTVLVVAVTWLVAGREGSAARLFADMYELTESRIAGILSVVGVVLLAMSASISLFASRMVCGHAAAADSGRWLLYAGLLTGLLALDDYLSIHEFADDLVTAITGVEAGRVLKTVLEGVVLGAYGLLFAIVFWRFRLTIAATEWIVLAIGIALLGASVLLDLAPQAWLEDTTGVPIAAQDLIEDTLKLLGLVFYATYLVRTSASVVTTVAREIPSGLESRER